MRCDETGKDAEHEQDEQRNGQHNAQGQCPDHACAVPAVAHELHQRDAETRHHGEQHDDAQDLCEERRLHSRHPAPAARFSIARVLPVLAACAAIVLFVRLGLWQLERADEVAALHSLMKERAQAPLLTLDATTLAQQDADALRGRTVGVQGSWESARQILLDNRISRGEAGYFVYTPLRIDGCGCALLVNRGWVAAGAQRRVVPVLTTPPGRRPIRAVAADLPQVGVGVRDGIETMAPGIWRVQRIDVGELSRRLGMRVLPLTLLLADDEPGGYRRQWQLPDLHADRHVAYALQWFSFALIVAALVVALHRRRG